MQRSSKHKGIDRIIDANINRAKEGLRVCEEITRFILNNRPLTLEFKKIRHSIDALSKRIPAVIRGRESAQDIGKNIFVNELKRRDYRDIFGANIQRVKESIRVLEEFSKLGDIRNAIAFKKIRYKLYGLEQQAMRSVS